MLYPGLNHISLENNNYLSKETIANFHVYSFKGLSSETDKVGVSLGNYTYSDSGKPIQYFPIQVCFRNKNLEHKNCRIVCVD